ncbi:hypothetical protein [Paraburkholderia sp.]|uniref:hypothetical protein n=1 Tax=Paraburkholderia sp. TaxID=1926495 RepID=UPI003D701897
MNRLCRGPPDCYPASLRRTAEVPAAVADRIKSCGEHMRKCVNRCGRVIATNAPIFGEHGLTGHTHGTIRLKHGLKHASHPDLAARQDTHRLRGSNRPDLLRGEIAFFNALPHSVHRIDAVAVAGLLVVQSVV